PPPPLVIRSGNSKFAQLATVATSQTLACFVEGENNPATGNLCSMQHRSRFRDFASIDLAQRPAAHALTNIELVFGMAILSFADIDGDDEPGFRHFNRRAPLCFAQKAPWIIGWLRLHVMKIGKLNDAEGEVSLAPPLPPGLDHGRQQDFVLLSAIFV